MALAGFLGERSLSGRIAHARDGKKINLRLQPSPLYAARRSTPAIWAVYSGLLNPRHHMGELDDSAELPYPDVVILHRATEAFDGGDECKQDSLP